MFVSFNIYFGNRWELKEEEWNSGLTFIRFSSHFHTHFFVAEIWSNGALDPWSGMGVYPESMGPTGPMVQEINEDTKEMCFHDKIHKD